MLLRDNLQPTDFADAVCRVSGWVETNTHAWDGSEVAAYRVWECRCSAFWFQRHEWLRKGENHSRLDAWAFSGYFPRRDFAAHMKPAPKDNQ